jgi:hypothetical protein
MSAPVIVTWSERPDLGERSWEEMGDVWPEYNGQGDVMRPLWARIDEDFPEFQFLLYDEEADEILAKGHSLPVAWDGTLEGLPAGIDGAIAGGFRLRGEGEDANTLSAMAVEVPTRNQNRGLSRVMIGAMRELTEAHGLTNLIAPVRPSWKERYPLTPIDRYVAWTRDDGLPFDPWIRVHIRLGGEILQTEPHSLRITGTVAEWEQWVGMRFPESGEYVFPQGLAPLTVDVDADLGSYWEPNVWMRHRVI